MFRLLSVALLAFFWAGIPASHSQLSQPDPRETVVIDFSFAGYGGGILGIPKVPTVLTVRPIAGDCTLLLQSALDRVSSLPIQPDGFRGAVELLPGRFRVWGQLHIRAAGVVLRGATQAGNSQEQAIIVAAGDGRRTLFEIGGVKAPASLNSQSIERDVAVGARELVVKDPESFAPGDHVVIRRPSSVEWIATLGMNKLPGQYANTRLDWQPGSRDLLWDRVVSARNGNVVTVDAPITTALEARFGGGTITKVDGGQLIRNIGVENLSFESEWDRSQPKDEEHAWIALFFDHLEDGWVRNVTVRKFASSAVRIGPRARRITVEDCRSEHPVSEVGGYRRQAFLVEGGQVLVRHCQSEDGTNEFAVGLLASGPNVFLDCVATHALGASGSFESWASGTLYENVTVQGSDLKLTYDMARSQGAGWTAANSVVWNSTARQIEVKGPEGAPNLNIKSVEPLYKTQLASRTQSMAATGVSEHEKRTVKPHELRLTADKDGTKAPRPLHPLEILNGRFVVDGKVLWGGVLNEAWWTGQPDPALAGDSGRSVTRFIPGRTGPGLTENLPELAAQMAQAGTFFFQDIPGLWYDRRRDEHSVVARSDGNVWAPFYEMPWARSGREIAWDGLSRFDVSKYNTWYFERRREFAHLAAENGLVIFHNIYNAHNVLEILPHWVDYPWRPANNVNDTGLPEPPPLEPPNGLHVGNKFYNISYAPLKELHRAYILHDLEQLGAETNILISLAFQNSGPLEFQQFFHDTVGEWERKTDHRARLILITSKDNTDAILADPARARQVAAINTLYWQYRPDGSLWAPKAGQNRAFREMSRASFGSAGGDTPPPTTPQQVYRQVREYRDRFPDKAIIAWNGGVGPIPVLMAGGAEVMMQNPAAGQHQEVGKDKTTLDTFVQTHLASVLMKMNPKDDFLDDGQNNWCLADKQMATVLVYSLTGKEMRLRRPLPEQNYSALWFDPNTGHTTDAGTLVFNKSDSAIKKPSAGDWLLLLRAR